MAKLKRVCKGVDGFESLIEKNGYYVDKTGFIRTVFDDDGSEVLLITRPRRFGKSLTLSTFANFLQINPLDPSDTSRQCRLFAGTEILSEAGNPEDLAAKQDFVRDFMGRYPVIFFSMKKVHGDTYEQTCRNFADTVNALAENFRFLLDSPKLAQEHKNTLRRMLDQAGLRAATDMSDVRTAIANLTLWLHLHFGVKPILLIDEYDVPLAKAEVKGYYKDMLSLMKDFLDPLKSNDHLYKAVLTGCLRISKESIFTGINHFSVNSVLSPKGSFAAAIGFTKAETEKLLEYYDLGAFKQLVKDNYDGYRFGKEEMFCPWDVVSFCDAWKDDHLPSNQVFAENYWTSTSGNDIIDEFADYIKPEHIDDMQTLVDGGSIAVKVRENLNYPDLKRHEIDAFWTMLLYSGYLTVSAESSLNLKEPQQVRIPNLEIKDRFRERILGFFEGSETGKSYAKAVAQAAVGGDADEVALTLMNYMQIYISIRDLATRAPHEDYYHGMLNALIGGSGMAREYRSNQEAGEGYADISFISSDQRTAVVIELKQTKNEREMDSQASSAVEQIIAKDYAGNYLARSLIKNVYAYGICFCRKSCSVSVKKLK